MSTPNFQKFALADDDSDDSELFCEALAAVDPKIECDKARNGKALLDQISHASDLPDVIFLDINMPEMNGWDCLAMLKRDSVLKNIPVVMYSTSSAHRDKQTAKQLGASFFYTKPDSFRELKMFLESLIKDPDTYNIRPTD